MGFFEDKGIESNPVLDRLPKHLLQFVVPQHYERYTAVDQAVWRYVMRKNVAYLQTVAHESYLEGLGHCGISTEEIPSMYGMNRILEKIGWAAVAVDGLIPTDAFLEFQAYNVLVIAADIRTLEDIEYTPVPDIIHESAGHAPIIANPEYSEFLRRLGQIGCRAIPSAKEALLQQAVRHLTDLKTSRTGTTADIENAEIKIRELQEQIIPSEMTGIKNLHWWSVEYGLIGTPDKYRIYGAGLLSSIGESKWCMSDSVAKIPYSLEAARTHFDYTKPQPQLFVTPDFAHLSYVVEAYANTMALRSGGTDALQKLIESENTGTIELSTGLQISGLFTKVITDERSRPLYFFTQGPTALAYREKELIGHGIINHPSGYGSPIGKLKGINLAIEDMSPRDLEAYHIYEGKTVRLEFEGGVMVQGEVITGIRNLMGKILLIRFKNCLVTYRDELFFTPAEGIYDMAVGKEIISGFAGAADVNSFPLKNPTLRNISSDLPTENTDREKMYRTIRELRNQTSISENSEKILTEIPVHFPWEWLLLFEAKEIAEKFKLKKAGEKISMALDLLKKIRPEWSHLISDN